MIPERMKAVVLSEPTRAEAVCLTEVPVPEVRPGWVLVKIHAFGMNHSEQILRQSEIRADYIKKPVIPGIECVGEIADPSDSRFQTVGMVDCRNVLGTVFFNLYPFSKLGFTGDI